MLEHGSFNLSLIDQTIISEAFGSWNIETAIRWADEFKLLVGQISNAPWACIVDLSNFELAPLDVWSYLDEINLWCNANNQKYEVLICSSSLQKAILEKSKGNLTNVQTHFCLNLTEGKKLLSKYGVINILNSG